MKKEKVLTKSREKSCGNCAVMDEVGEDDPCPYVYYCIVLPPIERMYSKHRYKKEDSSNDN